MGDIGKIIRKIELEPVADPAPVTEPAAIPEPAVEPEAVPA